MRWIIQLEGEQADAALAWARWFLEGYDTSLVAWVRIDRGRGSYEGVYGRCRYPDERKSTYRLSCQVPGPFPCGIVTRKPPLYQRPDGTFPRAPRGCRRGKRVHDPRTGRQWYRVLGSTRAATIDEGIVWILAHEAFHLLRHTRQIGGRDNEIEADRFADEQLDAFRLTDHASVAALERGQMVLPFARV
jgi:hypothetical protein